MREDIKAVIFDVDGTLIEGLSWVRLNEAMGVDKDTDDRLFNEFNHLKLFTYQEWVDQIVTIYKKRGNILRSHINHVLLSYTLRPGAARTIKNLKNKGYNVGIVSGGLDTVVYSVAKGLGVPKCYASANSTMRYDRCRRLQAITARGDDEQIKLQDLDRLCELWGLKPTQCAYVGDGPPDKALFEATKYGITFKEKRCEDLHGSCRHVISALPDLLKIL